MIKFNGINIVSALFLLLPFAIVTGSFLTDLIVVILALYFLFISIKERLSIYYKNYFTYIFAFFYLYILIRSLFSVDVLLSLEHSLFYFRYLFFVLCICYLINNHKNLVKYFMYSLLSIFVILIVDAYIQFFLQKYFWMENSINERLSGLFRDKYILGQYLARLYPVLLGAIFFTNYKNQISLKLAIILLFFIDVLVFISGDRTAFLLMTMSTIMILVLANQYKLLRLTVFVVSLISITLILSFNDKVFDRIVDETIQEAGINQDESYIISSTHQDLYTTSFKMFLDNKFFGQGPKMFRLVCSDDKFKTDEGCDTHPHSFYLQIMSELGIIGLTPILIAFLFINYILLMQLLSVLSIGKKRPYLQDSELFYHSYIYNTLATCSLIKFF